MSIVVTGGAGFIGRHLVERLTASGAAFGAGGSPVVVVDNLRRGSRESLEPLIARGAVRLLESDVRDTDALARAMRGAEFVFHLAAQSNVMGSEDDPDYTFTTNVVGTQNVLQAASAAGVRRVVFSSSREIYGQPASIPVAETAPLAPKNAYGGSKAAGEMLCRVAAERCGLEIVSLRLANAYGSGDSGRVIPLWLDRAARGEDLLIYGGTQVLDFIWVGDIVSALVRAALVPRIIFAAAGILPQAQAPEGLFVALNVGTGRGTAIAALADRVRDAVGRPVQTQVLPARSAEVERFVPNVTLMRRTLGLRPAPPLAHLPALAQEAIQRAALAGAVANPVSAVSSKPPLRLLAREAR